ncbi:hypothetical protein Tco_0099630 [Tanacetum coccineum]
MAPLTFADTHNMVAYLSKLDASEGFDQILDFLNASTIRYALTVNPTIYVSCIKQFWSTTKVKTVNGVVQLQALIDGKKVFVSEAIIRRDLHLEDAEGVECLPNNEIFEELARIGYEKPPPKLTFYKAFFALQWKFLIYTLIQCLSAKRTAWNEFSSTIASTVIYLATGRKFNFSKYIFDSMARNVDNSAKILMYPRFIQVFLDNQVDDMTSHHTKYTSPALIQKVFANIRRVDEDVEMPIDEEQPATTSAPSTSELQDQPSTPHDSLKQEPTHSSPYDLPLTGVNPPRKQPPPPSHHKWGSFHIEPQDQLSTPHDSPKQEPTHSSPHDSPLTSVNLPRSEEGSLQLAELMALCTSLQRKVDRAGFTP